jgi:hypothetical protein
VKRHHPEVSDRTNPPLVAIVRVVESKEEFVLTLLQAANLTITQPDKVFDRAVIR